MIGTVIGEITFEKSLASMREHRWVQVRAGAQVLEAVDLVGSEKGEMVLLLSGKTAQRFCMGCPGDWAAAAVLSGAGNNG